MELCSVTAAQAISKPKFPHPHRHTSSLSTNRTHLPYLSLNNSFISRNKSGLLYANSPFKSTISEETSSGATQYGKEKTDGAVTFNGVKPDGNSGDKESEVVKEDIPVEDQSQPFEFLDKLNLELNSEDPVPIILFGGGGLAALWFATAVVGAIDSIPVFPKLLEVVGLGYTIWFTTRYLLFKKNRDELAANIEEIKQQVLGSKGN